MMTFSQTISNAIGWILIVIGVIGFSVQGLLGMHLNAEHVAVLIVTGILSIFFAASQSEAVTRAWCVFTGLAYTMVSVIGLFCEPGTMSVCNVAETSHLLRLIPGSLEFGTADSIWQLIAGNVYLFAGFSSTKAAVAQLKEMPSSIRAKSYPAESQRAA